MVANPLVSIVIPTYNGGDYLVKTLESALAQDYPNTEIIVVDDGSPMDIASLVRVFGSQVTLLSQPNSGPGAARNLGARASKGEFIAFLDHDDLWAPSKISEQASMLIKNPDCGLVYCYPSLIDEGGVKIENTAPSHFPSGSVLEDFIKRNRITTFSAVMVRTSAFFEVGGIDESQDILTCDDYDLWLKLAACFQVEFVPGPLVFYRIHPGNLLNNHQVNLDAHLKVMQKCRHLIRGNESLSRGFDAEKAIAENELKCYRKFGFLFHHNFPNSNTAARNAFKEVLKRSPFEGRSWVYFFFTFQPFVLLRKIKRGRAGKSETGGGAGTKGTGAENA